MYIPSFFAILCTCSVVLGAQSLARNHQNPPTDSPKNPPTGTNFTVGYIRREYTDSSARGKFFVQAEAHVIGACYANTGAVPSAEPTAEPTAPPSAVPTFVSSAATTLASTVPPSVTATVPTSNAGTPTSTFRKLAVITDDRAKHEVRMYYADYTDAACTVPVPRRTSITVLKDTSTVVTSNDVQLTVDTRYIVDFAAATATPAQFSGYALRYIFIAIVAEVTSEFLAT